MKVLVTGGAGYIGSVCVEQLIEASHDVTVFDDLSEGHRSAVDSRAAFVRGSLGDEALLQRTMEAQAPDAVMHLAANALVGESMANPSKYFRNNVAYGVNLLNAAVAVRAKKFIFSSTCATYGLPKQMPITEDTPAQPVNPYGESKRIMELMLRWYQEIHGLEYVALRYFNAAGASTKFGEHHRIESHLIPNVLKVALGQAPHCEIFGTDYPTPDGTCIRDYIHIVDLAQAHILAMAPGKTGAFNLGNGSGYSVREVIQTCENVSGRKIKALEKPRRPGDPPRLVAAADKARLELGWVPQYPGITQIVESAWRWHSKHPEGYPD